jgi:hypothetical protein
MFEKSVVCRDDYRCLLKTILSSLLGQQILENNVYTPYSFLIVSVLLQELLLKNRTQYSLYVSHYSHIRNFF